MRTLKSMIALSLILTTVSAIAESPVDPSLWKVTFPVAGEKGNALEILNPELSNILTGKSALPEELTKYLQFSDDEIVFVSDYTGVTTSSNTPFSRTELRQMTGADEQNWKLDKMRKLECRLKVSDLLGGANKLFFMQIHGHKPESKPLLKVIWEKGYVRLLTKSGTNLNDFKTQQNYTKVGEDRWFTCVIHASPESLDVFVNGEKIESFGRDVLKHWPEENTYYFKAGNYLQHDESGAGATVTFSSIQLEE
jgi:hypothetical protein